MRTALLCNMDIAFRWCLNLGLICALIIPATAAWGYESRVLQAYDADRPSADSLMNMDQVQLEDVQIRAYFVKQPLLRATAAAAVVGPQVFEGQNSVQPVHALNSVPGVRMEERSPGSYRLSLRGSLLRSPYGVRNVKVYMDELPLTDAGGNTYFNVLDMGALSHIEVLKGPDGSVFGANSGGVVILHPHGSNALQDAVSGRASVQAGSFGSLYQQAGIQAALSTAYQFSFDQSYQRSDGYRDNTAMDKLFLQTYHQWDYQAENRLNQSNQLRLFALYGDLDYRTPGGLTRSQFEENPAAARPATPVTPGAVEQKAGIRNRTFFSGLTHDWKWNDRWKHVVAVFGSHTDFRNPFITNYEIRDESNLGMRTYLSTIQPLSDAVNMQVQTGIEWQYGDYKIKNFDNLGGVSGPLQSADRLYNDQMTSFVRVGLDWGERWLLETSLSHNRHKAYVAQSEWMPRMAFSFKPRADLVWRASVSRGFSPPTIAEIRPSDQQINTELKAETGWNYETGFRYQTVNRRMYADVSLFSYRMQQAIVRGLRESGAAYFYNAGEVKQLGLELAVEAWLLTGEKQGIWPGIVWSGHWALSHFRFGSYSTAEGDFSDNQLTGVPAHTVIQSLRFMLPKQLTAYLHYQYTSALPLNDANSDFADPYHLLQAKITWKKPLSQQKRVLQIFAGADNLLNQVYSLGNDINAFGGRYFNAAPARNYYAGVTISF